MDAYYVPEEAFESWGHSAAVCDYRTKMLQFAQTFSKLTPSQKRACFAVAGEYLSKDDDRYLLQEEGFVDQDDIFLGQTAETPEILRRIVRWFPFVAVPHKPDRANYAIAFVDFFRLVQVIR